MGLLSFPPVNQITIDMTPLHKMPASSSEDFQSCIKIWNKTYTSILESTKSMETKMIVLQETIESELNDLFDPFFFIQLPVDTKFYEIQKNQRNDRIQTVYNFTIKLGLYIKKSLENRILRFR